jgi:hypothetical protein
LTAFFPVEIRALAIAFFTRLALRLAAWERRFYLAVSAIRWKR